MFDGLPQDQKDQFDCAVRAFCQPIPVSVAKDKLDSFLEATRGIDEPDANRLRSLAIRLEDLDFVEGWQGLSSIYHAAAEANPTDPCVLHSWGISACKWSDEVMTKDPNARLVIAAEAERVLQDALILSPKDSGIAHTLGLLYYDHPTQNNALDHCRTVANLWFGRAVEWDPGNTIAQLYIAHCHHDRNDWLRAIAEYEKVDLARLESYWQAWRATKCREQLAMCYACSGNKVEAINRFVSLLDDIEAWDEAAIEDRVVNVDELVFAVANLLENPHLISRTRELVTRLGFQGFYQELFI